MKDGKLPTFPVTPNAADSVKAAAAPVELQRQADALVVFRVSILGDTDGLADKLAEELRLDTTLRDGAVQRVLP